MLILLIECQFLKHIFHTLGYFIIHQQIPTHWNYFYYRFFAVLVVKIHLVSVNSFANFLPAFKIPEIFVL